MQTIVLGGGCFWCTESVFLSVKGVQSVVSGYMGGDAVSANYEAVCSGTWSFTPKIVKNRPLIVLSISYAIWVSM